MNKLKYLFKKYLLTAMFIGVGIYMHAQTAADTEFPKGFIMYAKLHNGMVTNFTSSPDIYIGGIQLAPQYTFIPHLLRGGIIADAFYTSKKIQGAIGPSLWLKITTLKANLQGATVGSIGNFNVIADYLLGTGRQRLFGGGLIFDLGNRFSIGITAHRDYMLNTWWFQNELGLRISKTHKNKII